MFVFYGLVRHFACVCLFPWRAPLLSLSRDLGKSEVYLHSSDSRSRLPQGGTGQMSVRKNFLPNSRHGCSCSLEQRQDNHPMSGARCKGSTAASRPSFMQQGCHQGHVDPCLDTWLRVPDRRWPRLHHASRTEFLGVFCKMLFFLSF